MGDNVELKATVTSDAGQAKTDIKGLGDTVKTTGDQAKGAGEQVKDLGDKTKEAGEKSKQTAEDVDTLSDRFKKMASRETAEKILSLVDTFEKVGDVMTGIAENDAAKFESGMDAAVRGVTGVVGLIAPEFAPVVAIIGTVITKTATWALGMKDAAAAAKELEDALKAQHLAIERSLELDLLSITSNKEKLERQKQANEDLIKENDEARQKALDNEELYHKLSLEHDELWHKQRLLIEQISNAEAAEERAADQANRIQGETEAEEESRAIFEKGLDDRKKASDEDLEFKKELAGMSVQITQDMNAAIRDDFEKTEKYLTAAAFKGADATVKAGKMAADGAKKSSLDQQKAAEDLARKITSTTTEIVGILATGFKDQKAMAQQFRDFMLKLIIDQLTKQLAAHLAHKAAVTAIDAAHTASTTAFAGARAAAELSTVPPKVVSAYAPFPFVGVGLAAAAIAAFMLLAKPKMEEGGPVSGRVPGLGRQDRTGIDAASDEGVLTGAGMNTPIGALLGLINKGIGGNGAGAIQSAGTPQTINVVVSLADVPSDSELIRWIMNKINFRVTQHNGALVASRYHSQSGAAI